MTKGGGFAVGACRHHRADFHLGIIDDDPINEPFHQVSALGKCQRVQSRLQALTKCFHTLTQGGNVHGLLCLGIALPQWLREALLALRHLLASARNLLPLDHLRQVSIEQPRLLAFELRQDITQRLTARVQGLGQPGPHLRPFPFMGDEGRGAQDTAEVLPHACVQDRRGGRARGAALTAGEPQRLRTAPTEVIMVAGLERTTAAREATRTTADEAAESRGISGRVPTGHWHVTMQAVLGSCKGLLPDHGRHRHGHPLLRWSGLLTLARPRGLQSGCAPACRRGASPATLGHARGGRRAQKAPYRSDMPAFATPGRGHGGLAEARRSLRPAWGLAGVGIPGKHVLHHGRWHGVKTHAAGIARAVGIEPRALRRSSPREKLTTAPFGLAPASHALGNQGPLVLGHGGADVSKQLIMRISTPGPLDTRDATASLGAFVDQEHLLHIVTRAAIGRRQQHACKGGQRRPISEALKTGALEGGATLAVITGDVLVGHRPIGARRHVIA
jgi:hypothetical protein